MKRGLAVLVALALGGCVQLSPPGRVGVCRTDAATLHLVLRNSMFGISEIEEQNLSGVWTVSLFQGLDGQENERDIAIPQNTDFLRVNGTLYRAKQIPSCQTSSPLFPTKYP